MPRSAVHKKVVEAYKSALERQREVGFDQLETFEKELIATLLMHEDIRNGGFFQWFTNAPNDHTTFAIQFLKRVRAEDHLRLITKASALFPDGCIPSAHKIRWAWAGEQTKEKIASLKAIDTEYYALKRDLYDDMIVLVAAPS